MQGAEPERRGLSTALGGLAIFFRHGFSVYIGPLPTSLAAFFFYFLQG